MIRKVFISISLFCAFILINTVLLSAEEIEPIDKKQEEPGWFSLENPYKTGMIFNVSNILLDIESYQGGIGFKRYFTESIAYRASFDFGYTNSSNSWLIAIGNTIEYHLTQGPVSPYIGGFLDIGYASYKEQIDSDDWTMISSVPLSFGPLLGVEVEVNDIISLFAEYGITFDTKFITTERSVGGAVSRDTSTDFSINTGIGNDSKIGIIIYFNRVLKDQVD